MALIENRLAGKYYIYQFERHDARLVVLTDMTTVEHTFRPPQHYIRILAPLKEKWWGKPVIEKFIEINKFNKNSIRVVRIQLTGEKFWEHDWESCPPDVEAHFTGLIIKCNICGIGAEEFKMPNALSCNERVIKDIIE